MYKRQVVPYADLFRSIDALLAEGGDQFYVEVVSKPGHRSVKAVSYTHLDAYKRQVVHRTHDLR